MMKSAEIRSAFLSFFEQKQHSQVSSASLVPGNDPTLLFTNAGMVQFKDVFLGKESRSYQRACTAQKVVRAGGKHNDLDNVGYTARHHTFFEMLGNFSFGDYFKEDAITYAWEFLTEILKLPPEKLSVTVFQDDEESFSIWRDRIGVPVEQIIRLGEDSNFWSMGDTGPCGPCTEIFFDHGESIFGGPPGSPEEDGDRFVEIWNVVFMQYNRHASGQQEPLPKPSVDTGMGLERISAVMQGVHSNYDIDLFKALLAGIKSELSLGLVDAQQQQSLQVIADHIRSCCFLIADGVLPSNEGRGYVLRRIIRRALRHGRKLGSDQPFFHRCVKFLVAQMGEAYPELTRDQLQIEKCLALEEAKFLQTLESGMKILEASLCDLKEGECLNGEIAFILYDTYGFPVDLTADVARERGITVDQVEFDLHMAQQKARSKASGRFSSEHYANIDVDQNTDFKGYTECSVAAQVLAVFTAEGVPVSTVAHSDEALIVVLDKTSFYAESGGQIGDIGVLEWPGACFEVQDTQQNGGVFLHKGILKQGELVLGQKVQAVIAQDHRDHIKRNHSATHLLHAALQQNLGEQVQQKGSLVNSSRLRFDFSCFEPISIEQLQAIERQVNVEILANVSVSSQVMGIEEAKQAGAMALFGEKYGETVRVLSMGRDHFSVELCGGTHVERTGDIGLFKILSETGIAAGVRRIEAVTGLNALSLCQKQQQFLESSAVSLKTSPELLADKVQSQLQQLRAAEKEIERLKAKASTTLGSSLGSEASQVAGVNVLARVLPAATDSKTLRIMVDQLKQKLQPCAILLAAVDGSKVQLVACVSRGLEKTLPAGVLVNHVATQVGGKGGGKPGLAMAGGTQVENLPAAIDSVVPWVEKSLLECEK